MKDLFEYVIDMIGAATTEVEESDRSACNTLMEIAQLAEVRKC